MAQEQKSTQTSQEPKNTQPTKEETSKKQSNKKQKSPSPKPKKYRCTSSMIEVFEYKGKRYILYPNSIIKNLPEDAPQVKRLIQQKKLIEIK